MDYSTSLLYAVCACVAVHFLLLTVKKLDKSKTKKLAPGPPGVPVFGNLFSLGTKPHVSLAKLAKTYGPLMTLQLGRVPTVIISSAAVAKEALQKNDLLFSNRHILDAISADNHHEKAVGWIPVGPKWRNLRKICNNHVFSISRLNASESLRMNKVKDLITFVEKNCEAGIPVNIGLAATTTTLNLLSSTFFSMDLGDPNSEFASEFQETSRGLLEELGKPNFADYFPLLKKIDPQGIKRRAGIYLGKLTDLFKTIIDQRLQGDRASDSQQYNDVLDALLDIFQDESGKIELSELTHLLMELFSAGTDTTSSTFEWAMAELLHNPEKLKKAQAELREVIGRGKPVEETDIDRLPYLQAVVKETFRLHPAVPFLIPREVYSDVKLFDYTVPKNAQVMVNVWAIGRDPQIWENPDSFEPERFTGLDIDVKGRDFELIPFGAGRRICPGLPLANRMLHLMLGSLLNEFDWKLEREISAEKMDMEEKFGFTLVKAQQLHAIPVRF